MLRESKSSTSLILLENEPSRMKAGQFKETQKDFKKTDNDSPNMTPTNDVEKASIGTELTSFEKENVGCFLKINEVTKRIKVNSKCPDRAVIKIGPNSKQRLSYSEAYTYLNDLNKSDWLYMSDFGDISKATKVVFYDVTSLGPSSTTPKRADLVHDCCLLVDNLCDYTTTTALLNSPFKFLVDSTRYSFMRSLLQLFNDQNIFISNSVLQSLFILCDVSLLDYLRDGTINGTSGRNVVRELNQRNKLKNILCLFEKGLCLVCVDEMSIDKSLIYPSIVFRNTGYICYSKFCGSNIVTEPFTRDLMYKVYH